jgi:CMP-2-keto-3-deoxyoctulosonic acid synthetase
MCRAEYNDKNTVKVVHNAGQLMYMTREGEARFRQCGLYGFNRKELEAFSRVPNKSTLLEKYENIEIMRFAEIGYPVKMIEIQGSPEVNEPDDICVVEWLIEEKRKEELQWNSKNLSNLNLLY